MSYIEMFGWVCLGLGLLIVVGILISDAIQAAIGK